MSIAGSAEVPHPLQMGMGAVGGRETFGHILPDSGTTQDTGYKKKWRQKIFLLKCEL